MIKYVDFFCVVCNYGWSLANELNHIEFEGVSEATKW
jgi:hypothetical protein